MFHCGRDIECQKIGIYVCGMSERNETGSSSNEGDISHFMDLPHPLPASLKNSSLLDVRVLAAVSPKSTEVITPTLSENSNNDLVDRIAYVNRAGKVLAIS
jgi:hypothetical protein